MRYIYFLFLTCFTTIVHSKELIVHFMSIHGDYNDYFNNNNLGVGYRFNNGVSTGIYYNSYYNPSIYVSKDFLWKDKIGVFIGGATGYDNQTGYPVSVIGGGLIKLPISKSITPNIVLIPSSGTNNSTFAIHLSFSYKLD